VETFTITGEVHEPCISREGLLAARAPCFVCLKMRDGELRGCIGTIEPAKDTLAQEIVANAISAATNDPRFDPVTESELTDLVYCVDVLLPAEPAGMEELDPSVYGVIVEDESESRRGLLLPDIPGVDTAHQQVEIAKRKAGISPETPVKLSRFKVERYRELEHENKLIPQRRQGAK
jgi:AmmeMemoRadiSam system protein A